jgi:PAS domain S-box-containing protein
MSKFSLKIGVYCCLIIFFVIAYVTLADTALLRHVHIPTLWVTGAIFTVVFIGLLGLQRLSALKDHHQLLQQHALLNELLMNNEQRFRQMLDAVPDAVMILDEKLRIQEVNRSGLSLFEYEDDELIGQPMELLIAYRFRTTVHEFLMSQADSANGIRIGRDADVFARSKPGREFAVEMFVSSFPSHAIPFRICLIRDISERQELIQSLQTKEDQCAYFSEQARQANASKTEILARMSHELRTPMNAILGFIDLLSHSELTERQQSFVDAVKNNGVVMLKQVNDILELTKIQSGKVELKSDEMHLSEVIHSVFAMIINEQINPHIKGFVDIDSNLPLHVVGDEARLKQVLVNLLGNAKKFTSEGRITLKVEFVRYEGRRIVIQFNVKDTGVGIAREHIDNIFDPFVQVHDQGDGEERGTGLGLSIVKSLVDWMGGQVWVESQPGQGSDFYFQLPFDRVEVEKPTAHHPSALNSAESQPRFERRAQTNPLRLLVVEDISSNRDLIAAYLHELDMDADFVNDGQQAVERLRKDAKYDLCLMDVQMPVLGGLEATRIIRKEISTSLPIVALTAAVLDEDHERALKAGMNDFLAKPIDIQKLNDMIIKYTVN